MRGFITYHSKRSVDNNCCYFSNCKSAYLQIDKVH